MFCLACLTIKVLLCWKWSKTQEVLYARTVTFSVLKPVCVNKTALASLTTFGPYRSPCQKRQRLLNNSVSCYTRSEYYLCTGHQAWWLWSHVHECPLQPGSCVPGSPGRSHWWRTLWPCPALSPTMPDVRPLSCRDRGSMTHSYFGQIGVRLRQLNSVDRRPLPWHILMDALKTSLRVVLAHVRQVKIKIVEGVRGRISLGNFNALRENRRTVTFYFCLYTSY